MSPNVCSQGEAKGDIQKDSTCLLFPQAPGSEAGLTRGHRKHTLPFRDR